MVRIDFHTHTNASDGSFTPSELVSLALKQGMTHVAITDHDTITGIEEAVLKAENHDLEIIPGIELSLNYPGVPGSIHLLGLYIDYKSDAIHNYIDQLKIFRRERNIKIFEKMKKLDIDINERDFPHIPLEQLGRAHIGKMMLEKGYTKTINETFEKYLKKDAQAYVNKKRFSVEEGIEMVHAWKGVACLAHPYTLKLNYAQLDVFIKYLREACSLDGVEIFHPEHSPRFIEFYHELCTRYDLIPTGGSDFHGENKPDNALGFSLEPDMPHLHVDLEESLHRIQQKHICYA